MIRKIAGNQGLFRVLFTALFIFASVAPPFVPQARALVPSPLAPLKKLYLNNLKTNPNLDPAQTKLIKKFVQKKLFLSGPFSKADKLLVYYSEKEKGPALCVFEFCKKGNAFIAHPSAPQNSKLRAEPGTRGIFPALPCEFASALVGNDFHLIRIRSIQKRTTSLSLYLEKSTQSTVLLELLHFLGLRVVALKLAGPHASRMRYPWYYSPLEAVSLFSFAGSIFMTVLTGHFYWLLILGMPYLTINWILFAASHLEQGRQKNLRYPPTRLWGYSFCLQLFLAIPFLIAAPLLQADWPEWFAWVILFLSIIFAIGLQTWLHYNIDIAAQETITPRMMDNYELISQNFINHGYHFGYLVRNILLRAHQNQPWRNRLSVMIQQLNVQTINNLFTNTFLINATEARLPEEEILLLALLTHPDLRHPDTFNGWIHSNVDSRSLRTFDEMITRLTLLTNSLSRMTTSLAGQENENMTLEILAPLIERIGQETENLSATYAQLYAMSPPYLSHKIEQVKSYYWTLCDQFHRAQLRYHPDRIRPELQTRPNIIGHAEITILPGALSAPMSFAVRAPHYEIIFYSRHSENNFDDYVPRHRFTEEEYLRLRNEYAGWLNLHSEPEIISVRNEEDAARNTRQNPPRISPVPRFTGLIINRNMAMGTDMQNAIPLMQQWINSFTPQNPDQFNPEAPLFLARPLTDRYQNYLEDLLVQSFSNMELKNQVFDAIRPALESNNVLWFFQRNMPNSELETEEGLIQWGRTKILFLIFLSLLASGEEEQTNYLSNWMGSAPGRARAVSSMLYGAIHELSVIRNFHEQSFCLMPLQTQLADQDGDIGELLEQSNQMIIQSMAQNTINALNNESDHPQFLQFPTNETQMSRRIELLTLWLSGQNMGQDDDLTIIERLLARGVQEQGIRNRITAILPARAQVITILQRMLDRNVDYSELANPALLLMAFITAIGHYGQEILTELFNDPANRAQRRQMLVTEIENNEDLFPQAMERLRQWVEANLPPQANALPEASLYPGRASIVVGGLEFLHYLGLRALAQCLAGEKKDTEWRMVYPRYAIYWEAFSLLLLAQGIFLTLFTGQVWWLLPFGLSFIALNTALFIHLHTEQEQQRGPAFGHEITAVGIWLGIILAVPILAAGLGVHLKWWEWFSLVLLAAVAHIGSHALYDSYAKQQLWNNLRFFAGSRRPPKPLSRSDQRGIKYFTLEDTNETKKPFLLFPMGAPSNLEFEPPLNSQNLFLSQQ